MDPSGDEGSWQSDLTFSYFPPRFFGFSRFNVYFSPFFSHAQFFIHRFALFSFSSSPCFVFRCSLFVCFPLYFRTRLTWIHRTTRVHGRAILADWPDWSKKYW